jgi:hypothetical protein
LQSHLANAAVPTNKQKASLRGFYRVRVDPSIVPTTAQMGS